MAGDPHARERWARLLYAITGWATFAPDAEPDERAQVSRSWAEDWDSPEDSTSDDRG